MAELKTTYSSKIYYDAGDDDDDGNNNDKDKEKSFYLHYIMSPN